MIAWIARFVKFNKVGVSIIAVFIFALSRVIYKLQDLFYNPHYFLLLHTVLEFLSIAVSFFIAILGWVMFSLTKSKYGIIFGAVFLSVGALDFIHTMVFAGMPYGFNSMAGVWFWITARLTESVSLFTILLYKDHARLTHKARILIYLVSITYTVIVSAFLLNSIEQLPPLVVSGTKEPALAKILTEYFISCLHFLTIIFVIKQFRKTDKKILYNLSTASVLILLGELIFTLYKNVYDLDAVLGHIYKAVGYFYLLRAIYLTTIKRYYTRLQEAEQSARESNIRLSVLITNLNSGILVEDENNQIILTNERLSHLFKPFSKNNSIDDTVFGEHAATTHENILDIRYKKELRLDMEINLGDGRALEFDYIPIYIDDIFKGNLLKFTDVTSRKQQAIEIIQAKEEAERANQVKSDFLSRMSHELRTPLNSILGFAQLLEIDDREPLTEIQYTRIKTILGAGNHLLKLINDVLDLSKIESGSVVLYIEHAPIYELIKETLTELQPQMLDKELSMNLNLNDISGLIIKTDSMRLKQILINIIGNGVKYNRPKGALYIDSELVGHHLKIKIRDTGLGISPDEINKIFTPFYRSSVHRNRIQGTGIGLSISKHLIELMGGTIKVESIENQGSCFTLCLPLERKLSEVNKQAPIEAQNEQKITIPEQKLNLLYIEDNLQNFYLVKGILDQFDNVKLVGATSAEQGIDLMANYIPDLILLDINLPDINGFELLKMIKSNRRWAAIPIIAVSANAVESEIRRALTAGFDDYITKPININRFLEAVCKSNG